MTVKEHTDIGMQIIAELKGLGGFIACIGQTEENVRYHMPAPTDIQSQEEVSKNKIQIKLTVTYT